MSAVSLRERIMSGSTVTGSGAEALIAGVMVTGVTQERVVPGSAVTGIMVQEATTGAAVTGVSRQIILYISREPACITLRASPYLRK
jgi:hypothetical protein